MYFYCFFSFEYFDPYDHYVVCWVTLSLFRVYFTNQNGKINSDLNDIRNRKDQETIHRTLILVFYVDHINIETRSIKSK